MSSFLKFGWMAESYSCRCSHIGGQFRFCFPLSVACTKLYEAVLIQWTLMQAQGSRQSSFQVSSSLVFTFLSSLHLFTIKYHVFSLPASLFRSLSSLLSLHAHKVDHSAICFALQIFPIAFSFLDMPEFIFLVAPPRLQACSFL